MKRCVREQGSSGTKYTKKMEVSIESNVLSAMFFFAGEEQTMANLRKIMD
jgi:hypothetical protein